MTETRRLDAFERRAKKNQELFMRAKWVFDAHRVFGVEKKYRVLSYKVDSWRDFED